MAAAGLFIAGMEKQDEKKLFQVFMVVDGIRHRRVDADLTYTKYGCASLSASSAQVSFASYVA